MALQTRHTSTREGNIPCSPLSVDLAAVRLQGAQRRLRRAGVRGHALLHERSDLRDRAVLGAVRRVQVRLEGDLRAGRLCCCAPPSFAALRGCGIRCSLSLSKGEGGQVKRVGERRGRLGEQPTVLNLVRRLQRRTAERVSCRMACCGARRTWQA
jgi:hypothetical protein